MPYNVVLSIEDEKNKKSTLQFNIDDSYSLANAILVARGMAGLIDAAIRGVVRAISMSLGVTLPSGLRTTPLSGSDVEEGARFQFITEGGYYTGFRIPTFDEAYINADGSVDTTDANVQPIIQGMLGDLDFDPAVQIVTGLMTDARGDDVGAVSFARESFLSSRGSGA